MFNRGFASSSWDDAAKVASAIIAAAFCVGVVVGALLF